MRQVRSDANLRLRIPSELMRKLEAEADSRMLTVADIVRQSIAEHLGVWPFAAPGNATVVAAGEADAGRPA